MSKTIEKSEALLNSPLQRLSSKAAHFCIEHNLPYIHGCVWDRHCRWAMGGLTGGCRFVHLYWRRHHLMIELPGHDETVKLYRDRTGEAAETIPASWQFLPRFRNHGRTKKEFAKFKADYLARQRRP